MEYNSPVTECKKCLGSGSGATKVPLTENLSISNFDFLILDHFAKMNRNSRDKGGIPFIILPPESVLV